MELLGVGPLELVVIVLIALVIFSPKDLARGAKEVGRFINRVTRSDAWKSMRQVSREMQELPSRLAREAQLEELGNVEKDINAGLQVPASNTAPAKSKLPPAQKPPSAAAAEQKPAAANPVVPGAPAPAAARAIDTIAPASVPDPSAESIPPSSPNVPNSTDVSAKPLNG